MATPTAPKPHSPPVFPPHLHNETMQALSVFLMQLDMLDEHLGVATLDINPLRTCADAMADALIDELGSGCDPSEPVPLRDTQYAHPVKVAELSGILGRLAGGGRAQLRQTILAALLMNVGYTRIRPGAIEYPGPLSEHDWEALRKHPVTSCEILGAAGLPQECLDGIAQHHERWDGSGYPQGRRGKHISIYARIIGAADTYVALCSQRFHRPARPRHVVDEFFVAESGTLFDPAIIRLLLEELPRRYERPD